MVMIKPMCNGKPGLLVGVIRVVTSHQGFTRAFSIRVFKTRNVVPTVIFTPYDTNEFCLVDNSVYIAIESFV